MWSHELMKRNAMLALDSTLPNKDFLVIPNGEDHILMQYTGLKDKNGKEGYHHSLIKHESRNQGNPIEIVWDDGSWKGRYCGSRFSGFVLNQWEMNQAEIIGHIYENPELLNEKP